MPTGPSVFRFEYRPKPPGQIVYVQLWRKHYESGKISYFPAQYTFSIYKLLVNFDLFPRCSRAWVRKKCPIRPTICVIFLAISYICPMHLTPYTNGHFLVPHQNQIQQFYINAIFILSEYYLSKCVPSTIWQNWCSQTYSFFNRFIINSSNQIDIRQMCRAYTDMPFDEYRINVTLPTKTLKL